MIIMEEIWKAVPSCPGYLASSFGRVAVVSRTKCASTSGYFTQSVTLEGLKTKVFLKHRMVAEAFLGPIPEGALVRHLNGDPTDNRAENLAYGNAWDNAQDAKRHGRKLGAASHRSDCPCILHKRNHQK